MSKILFVALAIAAWMIGFVPTQVYAMDHAQHAACIKSCHSCGEVCEKTLAYCKKEGGQHADAKHLSTLQDCISACKTSEEFMKRGSAMMTDTCALCEKACLKCAESCDTFKDDKVMKACAEECRKCAESCKKMQSGG